ncbi:MAG: cation:proton antiporter [Bacteroidetes bacterium]|nr:cation:proton antiporter [Bacteroidota bacterium]
MHLPPLITDLALILLGAAVFGILFRFLKQPIVLGYIIAGVIVGPYFKFFPTVAEIESIKTWAEIGVIFLLFNLGLEFSFKKLLKEGSRIIVIALMGVGLTLLSGFLLGKLLGWNNTDSIFMGGILGIASTTIIIRAFQELNVKTQKFTNIVTSVLIVEDLAAVILMVILTTLSISREFEGTELLFSVSKLFFFLVLWFVSGIFFLPSILKFLKNLLNEEILLIFSLALCFALVIMALYAGFSPAFGAFIMGSILAETTKAERIEHLISSLKNLFGAIFFVSVGMLINPNTIIEHIIPVALSVLILIFGKPLFIIIGSVLTGQPLKIAVQTGMSLSQIGEFSFIIASLGLSLKVTSDFLYPVAVAVSVITTFTTPYMIKFSENANNLLQRILPDRWNEIINNYSISTDKLTEISEWRKLIRSTISNSIIFIVIIVTIILINIKFIQPYFWEYKWSRIITAVITIVFISPFLWALSFRRGNKNDYAKMWSIEEYRSPLVTLQLVRILFSIVLIGFLFDSLFSTRTALLGVFITFIALYLFRKRIQKFYGKIEGRFLLNLNERETRYNNKKSHLTPWDTHLSSFKLNSHSPFIGKMLLESEIREKFGVNIAAIDREDITINVPDRFERLYPQDIISVIGTDDQLKKFKDYIEKEEVATNILKAKTEIKLLHFTINTKSVLIGKSIKTSNIRERTKGLVVGVERDGKRILNPESDLIFKENDKVWIVGNEKRILIMAGEKF